MCMTYLGARACVCVCALDCVYFLCECKLRYVCMYAMCELCMCEYVCVYKNKASPEHTETHPKRRKRP